KVVAGKVEFAATIAVGDGTDPIQSERSVSRMTLRQVLFTGMEDVVQFDKTFTRYQQHDGKVTAHFSDGTSATGDVLVAADGANSAVRRQYLPHATLKHTGIVSIAAKVPVTDQTKALLPAKVFNGLSLVFAPGGQFGIWHVMEFKWDTAAAIKGGIGASDAELIEQWPWAGAPLDQPPRLHHLGPLDLRGQIPARRNGSSRSGHHRARSPHDTALAPQHAAAVRTVRSRHRLLHQDPHV